MGSSNSRLWTALKLFRADRIRMLATHIQEDLVKSFEDEFMKKLIYCSKVRENQRRQRYLNILEAKAKLKATKGAGTQRKQSIALKFYTDTSELSKVADVEDSEDSPAELSLADVKDSEDSPDTQSPVVMPMGLKVADVDVIQEIAHNDVYNDQGDTALDSSTKSVRKIWTNDYVEFTHSLDPTEPTDNEWSLKYGSSDPKIPSSRVPCGGCGAMLHCKDASIPGFIPQEIFTKCKTADLRTITCQRCYFLQNHNTALSIAVNPKVYPQIISGMKKKNALVLLAIDLTDFPCSIWPGITDLVGLDCPFFLVGNKIDLLKGDSGGWMAKIEKSLRSFFPAKARILGTQLISAKTGFGVETLITKLQQTWRYQGDVYLVGCTNVGKSTLFNALLQSDYCKVKAADLVQRATTAPWPGTTLNLLKFPIMRPEGWRVYLRTKRLKEEATRLDEINLRKQQMKATKKVRYSPPQLIGHIGRTFHVPIMEHEDAFAAPDLGKNAIVPGSGLNPNNPEFSKGRWFYDTPGVLHHDQILDLLTTEELVKVLPQSMITPRIFLMKPGWTMFIGGLARVDFIHGTSKSIKLAVFVSKDLPITICFTSDAQEVYDKLLGSDYFTVPSPEPERLQKWPGLKSKPEIKFSGIGKMVCCGDIVLSSSGWVSFAPDKKEIITVKAWTPEARGIYTRPTAVLPYAITHAGTLMKGTPAFHPTKILHKED